MRRDEQVRRGIRLEYVTLAWNSLEALVAIMSGLMSGSVALMGFGLDSVIEVSSGATLLWRLKSDADEHKREHVERVALRLVGACFIALAVYVALDATKSLWLRERAERSVLGIIIAALALVIMPLLARAKRRVAAGINSGAMQADSRQTDICAYLSAILLAGLVLNAVMGWWWADPVAGLIMVPIILKEGLEALRGKTCACRNACTPTLAAGEESKPCRG